MKFRTEIILNKSNTDINYDHKLFLIGSCFSENIGEKLLSNKFESTINPFGILYNPISILRILEIIIESKKYSEKNIQYYNKKWFSFDFHSLLSKENKDNYYNEINKKIINASKKLKEANFLFITFGTAFVYKLIETNQIVANCHKLPNDRFEKALLDVSNIVEKYKILIEKLKVFNPKIKIIFTVSPVRHWKDGYENNQVSKSTLIIAINKLKNDYLTEYFPAYEIVLDDLRDYRFYKEDLLHPNNIAIEYIWEKFSEKYFSPSTKNLTLKIEKIIKSLNHRPLFPNSENHKLFLKDQLKKIDNIINLKPSINWNSEIDLIKKNLT